MKNFTLSLPTEIFFGKSQIDVLGDQIKKHHGSKVLICYGSRRIKENGLFDTITNILSEYEMSFFELSNILPNPRITSVRDGVALCKKERIDFILAVGGGSVVDCAKAVAAGACYSGDPWDFFTGGIKVKKALPVATVLTLAATGSEMNGNAVISNLEVIDKRAVMTPLLKPKFSICDPQYTFSVPAYQTAAGTVDIMSHVFEQYFHSAEDIFLQSRLCEAILQTAMHCGPRAIQEPIDYEARADLLFASTLALNDLLGFGYDGDWSVHAIEHAVSAVSDLTHVAGLVIITPAWMRYVIDETNTGKFYSLAINVFGVKKGKNRMEAAQQGIDALADFFAALGMPRKLEEVGIKKDQLEVIARKAAPSDPVGSLKELHYDDVLKILQAAF